MKGLEIQNLVFSGSFFGYKKSDVTVCLKEISQYAIDLENKILNLERERDELKDELNKNRISRSELNEIILHARRFSENIELEAKEKAKDVIKKATAEAKAMLDGGKKKYDEMAKLIDVKKAELDNLKRIVSYVKKTVVDGMDKFLSVIEFKEKSVAAHENLVLKSEKNDVVNQIFGNSNINAGADDGVADAGNDDEGSETIEFNTKVADLKNGDDDSSVKPLGYDEDDLKNKVMQKDISYIKSRFSEIEFR